MDKYTIKKVIESNLKGSIVEVSGGEGKYTASVIYEGFNGLSTINRHKMVYSGLDSYIKSGELHAISLKTFTNKEITWPIID